jgi:hypothetical protein
LLAIVAENRFERTKHNNCETKIVSVGWTWGRLSPRSGRGTLGDNYTPTIAAYFPSHRFLVAVARGFKTCGQPRPEIDAKENKQRLLGYNCPRKASADTPWRTRFLAISSDLNSAVLLGAILVL